MQQPAGVFPAFSASSIELYLTRFFSEMRLPLPHVALWNFLLLLEAIYDPSPPDEAFEDALPLGAAGFGELVRGFGAARIAVRVEAAGHGGAFMVSPAPSRGTRSIAIG